MIVLLGGSESKSESESGSESGSGSSNEAVVLTNQKSVEFIPGSLIPCPISTEYLEAYIGMCMRVRDLVIIRNLLFLCSHTFCACFFFPDFTQTNLI